MDEVGTVFTVEEAAGLLRIHPETVRREIKAGKMPACRIGRDYRISRADLEGYYRAGGGGSLFPNTVSAGDSVRFGNPALVRREPERSNLTDAGEPSTGNLPLLTHADMVGIDCRAVDPRCPGIRLDEAERRPDAAREGAHVDDASEEC